VPGDGGQGLAEITFDIETIDYAALARRGDVALLARLSAPGGLAGYPLLDRDRPKPSDSPWLDRGAVAREIARQNPALPAPPPECDYIVAGQQAGLLTGPLYTFLKAVTAIAVARGLSVSTGRTIRPLFWVASEDHDVLEVNRCTIGDRRFVQDYPGEITRGHMPQVADIDLRAAREPLLEFLRTALPATEFTPWVLDQVAAADWRSYATAFGSLLRGLFARWDLRLVDPIALRPLTAPVLAACVSRWPAAQTALAEGAARLRTAGFEAPIGGLRLFEIANGLRVPIEATADGLRIDGQVLGWEQAAEAIRRAPERFSGGAILRPVCQDGALPIVATIGGPSELAYLWQADPVAACAGVRSSALWPRISATFVGPPVARALAAAGIDGPRAFRLGQPARDGAAGDERDPRAAAIELRGRELLQAIDALALPGDPRWLRSSREAIESAVARVAAHLDEERLAAQGRTRERLEKIEAAILPEGRLQERVANVYQFLNLHGPDFIQAAVEELDPWTLAHQFVRVRTRVR
jgi:bacillithiol synthase